MVPTRKRVTGMIAAIRIRNGSERPMLTMVLRTRNTDGLGRSPNSEVLCRTTPSGMPASTTSVMVTPTMIQVSP